MKNLSKNIFLTLLIIHTLSCSKDNLYVTKMELDSLTNNLVNTYIQEFGFEEISILFSTGSHKLSNRLIIDCTNGSQLPFDDSGRKDLCEKMSKEILSSLDAKQRKTIVAVDFMLTESNNQFFLNSKISQSFTFKNDFIND